MNHHLWDFYIVLLMLTALALTFALYPLRRYATLRIALLPLLLLFCGYCYWSWGGFFIWQNHLQFQEKQKQVQALLEGLNNPQDLIAKLRSKLHDDISSAKGWYLLGKLYASQHEWSKANEAFTKAHDFLPNDKKIAINYLQSQWQLNHQHFDEASQQLISSLLNKDPNQPDLLAMLALDAFLAKNYKVAIYYWKRLLPLLPKSSQDAQKVSQAIINARNLMTEL
ncbi:MAG: tetratricopeptide repeat protein [Legionella sp.]